MKIVITTMNNLPEYCWNCPCCSSVGRCRADEERRKTSEYRPFWCPLREEKEDATSENSVHPALIDKVPYSTSTMNCITKKEFELSELRRKGSNYPTNIRVSCDMCGKVIEREYLATINDNVHVCKDCEQWFTEHLTKSEREQLHIEEEEKVYIAECDRCGKIVESNSLTTVLKIRHGGASTVNYPHGGDFRICKDCERWLLKQLTNNKKEE